MRILILLVAIPVLISGCKPKLNVDDQLEYCKTKVVLSLGQMHDFQREARNIEPGGTAWNCTDVEDWTSGFWPGILWYSWENSQDTAIKAKAVEFTEPLRPLAYRKADNHDLGFMVFCSFGNGYRLTKNPEYRKILLAAADTLATLYNPKTGTILSWPKMVKEKGWQHNTIIDNMMNLELLFWAGRNGSNSKLYEIAVNHAITTMRNHFRPDYSAYHVVVYDTLTGKKINGLTHQGFKDESMWARGQAWAIYGYTLCYRETRKPEFLDFAQKVADVYLKKLPEDYIPYWDFDAPGPNRPKDASAASITASALLELSGFVGGKKGEQYHDLAVQMLISLSGASYRAPKNCPSFLLHSTGHLPGGKEIDYSIIYADYYYLEALMRLKLVEEGRQIAER